MINWCEYCQCECHEVNEGGSGYKCPHTDDADTPCDECEYFEERDEDEWEDGEE